MTLLEDIIIMYPYGSRIYGTDSKDSDYDYIVVKKGNHGIKEERSIDTSINFNIYDEKVFQDAINNHEISVLECLSLPKNQVIALNTEINFDYKINLNKLRESISKTASNSFVKAKKKLTIEKDFNPYIAKKSLFHSLRILSFGIQLAKYGKIVYFGQANNYWQEIESINSTDWQIFKEKYQPVYNKLSSEFKLLAPKK